MIETQPKKQPIWIGTQPTQPWIINSGGSDKADDYMDQHSTETGNNAKYVSIPVDKGVLNVPSNAKPWSDSSKSTRKGETKA